MRRPIRSAAIVRIWLLFTDERFGRFTPADSSLRENPACCGWLVRATAMAVPGRALTTS